MRRSVFLLVGVTGCDWLSLAANALTYETLRQGAAGNVAVIDSTAYVTLAEDGLAVVAISDGQRIATIAPGPGSESVDDVAIDGDLLFALDARPPGSLSVYSIRDQRKPLLVARRSDVPVGPFSGVSASNGFCVVSGGTSALTVWRYDGTGTLTGPLPHSTADLGRGQPDVLVSRDGRRAFVSTHFRGPYFGLTVLAIDSARQQAQVLSTLELQGAGFTKGGSKPANFPIEMAQLGDSLLLVAFARGVASVDVSYPDSARLISVTDVGGPAVNVDAVGQMAIVAVAGQTPSLVLVDFSASEPRIARRVALAPGTNPSAVAFSGGRIVVAARDKGVLVIDR